MAKFLIVGAGGREAAFAELLSETDRLYAVMAHENPQIADCARRSGGGYSVCDADDPRTVAEFAKRQGVETAFVNADQPLANGVVDALAEAGVRAVGATRSASRVEWDKAYAMDMMRDECPEFTPFYRTVSDRRELAEAMSEFESRRLQVVVKPQGLTGGKGVKVMPEHLPAYADCSAYAERIIAERAEKALLVERLDGPEFTLMGLTDGRHLQVSPASYDYPFRCEGDTGAGTGGMGCFTDADARLPFLQERDLADCAGIMQKIIDRLRGEGAPFTGVLNGGFFKTARGIRFMEFNARFGDPEGLNVLSVLETPLADVVSRMHEGSLSSGSARFARKASVSKYLVAREYPDPSPAPTVFGLDSDAAGADGVRVFFASCVRSGQRYETLKKSRVAAFCAVSGTVEGASSAVDSAIEKHFDGDLEYRRDIGSAQNLQKLAAAGHGG